MLLYPYEAENAVRLEAAKRGHAIQAPQFNQESVPISGTPYSVHCPIGLQFRQWKREIDDKFPRRVIHGN